MRSSCPIGLIALSLVAGCELADPCPEDTMRRDRRCTHLQEEGDGVSGDAGEEPDQPSVAPDAEGTDASDSEADPIDVTEAAVPGELDAGSALDGSEQASTDDGAASSEDADGAAPDSECTAAANTALRRFQISEGVGATVAACYANDPDCSNPTASACSIVECVKEAAQVEGCDRCIAAETECAAQHCSAACSIRSADHACRACACAQGCDDAPLGCGASTIDPCAGCAGASCGAGAVAGAATIVVPLFFHFLYDRIDSATGLPAYAASNGQLETMRDIDRELERVNGVLAASRPDARSLSFVRAGVAYRAHAASDGCPAPDAIAAARPLYGTLNIVLTSGEGCASEATSANAGRARASSLFHVLGHMLGLSHLDRGNDSWDTVELLHRERDPDQAASCFRRGDFTCDTPPDYGYVGANRCATLISGRDLCSQVNAYPFGEGALPAPCDPRDAVVDARGVCTDSAAGASRTYDPERLGRLADRPANVMSAHQQATLTGEQLLRMHNYAHWRLRASAGVSAAEQRLRFGFMHAPADPVWTARLTRDHALSNASVFTATARGPWNPTDSVYFEVPRPLRAGRVLGARLQAKVTGQLAPDHQIVIYRQYIRPVTILRGDFWLGQGTFTVDEALSAGGRPPLFERFRSGRSWGPWQIELQGSSPLTVDELTLEVIQSDRAYRTNDRHARGVSDLMAYRRTPSSLLTSLNLTSDPPSFGAPSAEPVAPLPDPAASVISGDVDGDGTVDLVARTSTQLWVAYGAESYASWELGSYTPSGDREYLLGDFDGDGFADLVSRAPDMARGLSRWLTYRGRGDGTFEAARAPVMATGTNHDHSTDVFWTAGDIDGDGFSEIVALHRPSGVITVTNNDTEYPTGEGALVRFGWLWAVVNAEGYQRFSQADRIVIVDVNQDHKGDMVARRRGTGNWYVSLNVSAELFSVEQPLAVGAGSASIDDGDTLLGTVP